MPPKKRKADDCLGPVRRSDRVRRKGEAESLTVAHKTGDMAAAARYAVLNTTELVHRILVHLDMLDALTAQRVCWTFRNVVDSSLDMQRKLFFNVDLPKLTWTRYCDQDIDGECAKFYMETDFPVKPSAPCDTCLKHPKHTPIMLNPLLEVIRPRTQEESRQAKSIGQIVYPTNAARCQLRRQLLGVLNEEASWRRMYLCDPPCHHLFGTMTFVTSQRPVDSVDGHFTPTIDFYNKRDHKCSSDAQDIHHISIKYITRQPDTEVRYEWKGHIGWALGPLVEAVLDQGLLTFKNGKRWALREDSVEGGVRALEHLDHREAYIDSKGFDLHLSRFIVATEEEWREMKDIGRVAARPLFCVGYQLRHEDVLYER